MRSALLCVFFALIIHNDSRADSDFRPIPIPLEAWNYERREARVGTLHEIKTDAPPAVAAVPAHYWEDALRHSVYLTLVRDKIDQLIARGVVVSPNSKPEQYVTKEIDDHDLWEKIKKAPFDRLKEDDHLSMFGDVTVMAKGRLMEDNGGYRFTEDERSKEDCSDDKCIEGVKAFWSVKRVRQRDVETSTGKYHYELTFSVNSQLPKKQKRPHENLVRTFTVRENAPDVVLGKPQENLAKPPRTQTYRPQRAVWFHKNIAPKLFDQGRFYNQALDRIFSSFFSDDDSHPEPPPRYKFNPHTAPGQYQYSKNGYAGPSSEQYQQKRLMPYPYKPHHVYKYRPPLPAPPVSHIQQHYIDVDVVKHPYVQQPQPPDHRYLSPSNIVKTTRPAVIPTPSSSSIFNTTLDLSLKPYNITINEDTTRIPDVTTLTTTVYKTYHKHRPNRVNFFPEHIRPPIYNAPPGVFLTMDKKPFKPMPPLKYNHHSSKPSKRPIDFRPSPQFIDGQFTSVNSDEESVFRPILIKNQTVTDSTEDIEVTQSPKQSHKRKQISKKPLKKHENVKWLQETTVVPDIITVSNGLGHDDSLQWADVLGAFSKTTPMHSQNDKKLESTTQISHSTTKKGPFAVSEAYEEATTKATTTTSEPKKRTRPPHKFVKQDKAKKHSNSTQNSKKHKRITTTTTTQAPEKLTVKKPSDLTPQASSAATNSPKWKPKNKTTNATTQSTTTTTTTTTSTTTEIPTSQNPPPAAVADETTNSQPAVKPTQPKSKNRFRMTTLMLKGTSVKHDRWSTNNTTIPNKKVTVSPTGKNVPRRKGSNFHGYTVPSPSKYSSNEDNGHRVNNSQEKYSITTDTTTIHETTETPKQISYEEIPVHFGVESTLPYKQNHQDNENNDSDDSDEDDQDIQVKQINSYDQEMADHAEFIFDSANSPSEKTNEIIDEETIGTEQTIITTSQSASKNKTRCKKKKHNHLMPTVAVPSEEPEQTTSGSVVTTKSSPTGVEFLDDLIGSLTTYEETTEKPSITKATWQEFEEEESENHEKYIKLDEDFEELFDNLHDDRQHGRGHSDDKDEADYEDEDPDELADDERASEHARDSHDKDYEDYRERPYSLLELMAME